MNKLKCCGAINFNDWKQSQFVRAASNTSGSRPAVYNKVAESCCKSPSTLCAKRDHPSNINLKVSKQLTDEVLTSLINGV